MIAFKGTIRRNPFRREHFNHEKKDFKHEIETESENILACLSGAQIGLNHEKNGGRKSRDTLPLNQR